MNTNFVVIVTNKSDDLDDGPECHGPFSTADGSGDSENDAVTWMAKYIHGFTMATAVEMLSPKVG